MVKEGGKGKWPRRDEGMRGGCKTLRAVGVQAGGGVRKDEGVGRERGEPVRDMGAVGMREKVEKEGDTYGGKLIMKSHKRYTRTYC